MRFVGKIAMLIFNDTMEKAVEKSIGALADMIPLEAIQPPHSPALIFPGLEIRLHQRWVLKDGIDVSLARLEYGALCYLAASPGRVFTKAQIFEAVWSMESESCQSNVTNVICNLRKKVSCFFMPILLISGFTVWENTAAKLAESTPRKPGENGERQHSAARKLVHMFPVPQGVQFQLIIGCDLPQLGNIEYRQPRAAGNQNQLRGFASDVL